MSAAGATLEACQDDSFHVRLRTEPVLRELDAVFAGSQPDGDGGYLDLFHCPRCGSTIAVERA